jgi:inorganic phosphate transporter, PiT family
MAIFLYLSSGLFLGWSLGANHAGNVFGTAVGSRMVRFQTAALICTVFVILGATVSGAGAAHTLGRLGAVNTLPGAFTVCLAVALTIYWMTRLGLPVSTSEGMVGGILGWNFYTASATNPASLGRIVGTWAVCPLMSAVLAALLFLGVRAWHRRSSMHLLQMDWLTRWGLLVVGAFGAYSLGANNIANVMGVFLPDNPFHDLTVGGLVKVSGTQQLFFLGAAAIGVGVFTYSHRVIETVGAGVMRFSPLSALVVVLAHSIVLFLFASEGLEHFLSGHGLPTIPLVPVSSSQAVVGAIIGIGLVRGGRELRWKTLGGIAVGWLATPVMAGALTFVSLFFVENVFRQEVVHRPAQVVAVNARAGIGHTRVSGLVSAPQLLCDRTVASATLRKEKLECMP